MSTYFIVAAWSHSTNREIPFSEVNYSEKPQPAFTKIVFIMDESVRGDYLSITEADRETTPFLESINGRLANFGVAISGANCSHVSRLMFRHGARLEQIPYLEKSYTQPTIWQYAHKAGLKTLYIDAWTGPLGLHSGMTLAERRLIDTKISVLDERRYMRDTSAAEKLIEALRDGEPTFIYVDKWGAHDQYRAQVPPEFSARRDRERAAPGSSDEQLVNEYKDAMTWSVDEFFRKVLPAIDLSKTLIVYTSDHGVNLRDGPSYYKQSHCNYGDTVNVAESFVPLLAITGDEQWSVRLRAAAKRGHDSASHFEIFFRPS